MFTVLKVFFIIFLAVGLFALIVNTFVRKP